MEDMTYAAIERSRCRTAARKRRYRFAHKMRILGRRAYALLLMLMCAVAAAGAVWVLVKIVKWTVIFFGGLINLI